MHSVGIDRGGECGIVVDDEQRPGVAQALAQRERASAALTRAPARSRSWTMSTPPASGGSDHALERVRVPDQVEPCAGEPFAAGHRAKVCQHGETMDRHEVIVVGGGVIGCSIAWRAAQRGMR